MRAPFYVFSIFLSAFLNAGTDQVPPEKFVYYLDPFDVSVTENDGTEQIVQFGKFEDLSHLNRFNKHHIATHTAFLLDEIIAESRRDGMKLRFDAREFKPVNSKFFIDGQNINEVWSKSEYAIDTDYQVLSVKEFLEKFSLTQNCLWWPCAERQWRLNGGFYSHSKLPEEWYEKLDFISTLGSDSTIKVTKYLTWAERRVLPRGIPLDLIFVIDNKSEKTITPSDQDALLSESAQ